VIKLSGGDPNGARGKSTIAWSIRGAQTYWPFTLGVPESRVDKGATMTDNADKARQDAPSKITISDTGLAPFIFFEGAPSFGNNNGVVNITLAANRHLLKDGLVASDVVAVGYLRCNIPAAVELRNAIDSALLLGAKTEGPAN
jgi:hypothetical protein